jgi:hypothetical protein
MEALVILLAEFLLGFIAPAVLLAAEIVALLIGALAELLGMLLFRRRRKKAPAQAAAFAPEGAAIAAPRPSGWRPRRLMKASLVALVLTVGGLVLVNTLFFEPVLRQVVALVAKRTKTEIAFASASGNFFTGRVTFADISAKRASDTRSSFDLKARRLDADLDLWSLIARPIRYEALAIDGVTGTMHQPERKRPTGAEAEAEAQIRAKRRFRAETLTLSNVEIALSRGPNAPVAVSLTSATSAPFRSNFAIFDLLFRSNVTGRLDGHDITIVVKEVENGRITQWRTAALPAATVSRFTTKPPIGWLREGTLTINVDDRWTLAEKADIDMDWNIRMQGVRAEPHDDASLRARALALPVLKYIEAKDGNLDLRFRLLLNESQFENMVSLDASDLWSALTRAMARSIADSTGQRVDSVKEGIGNAIDRFKGFLDRKRKPEDAQ